MKYSSIQAIDFALGSHIAKAFPVELNPTGPKNWASFAKRPIKQKIMRGDFESASDVLKSIESSQKMASQSSSVKYNPVSLPIVAYGRKPAISPSEADAGSLISSRTVDVLDTMDLQLAQVDIEYRMLLMAWDIPTLDQMQLAWMFYAAYNSEFTYQVEVDGELITLNVRLLDTKTPLFEDASIPSNENRLHAVMLVLSARTYVIKGQIVSIVDPINIHFTGGHIE